MSDVYEYKTFTNSSDLDFEFQYDGKKHMVKAGQTKIFPLFLTEHAAKHFIDREIIREHNKSRVKSIPLNDTKVRQDIYDKCVSDPANIGERVTSMTKGKDPEPEPAPAPAEPVAAKKMGRPKMKKETIAV